MLKGKKIILGITGSIAAYKAAFLIRLFKKNGAEVKVVMTTLAKEFITPVTLATLSNNTVLSDFFNYDDGEWNSHVDLGVWADAMVIAPATANTIAKMANGIADNLLLTTYLSARCPVFVAPAMDVDMFKHPATITNIEKIKSFGNYIIEPTTGELASGLEGKGRMEDPENILKTLTTFFNQKKKISNKKFVVTAGPTYEAIDPVRFIGNHSSGKMGFAIAQHIADCGGDVTLITGPTHLKTNNPAIKQIDVISADEMYNEVIKYFPSSDVLIMSAAVADFTPVKTADKKIKKSKNALVVELKPTKDILKKAGEIKKQGQLLIGFALETDEEIKNAEKKLHDKNLDFIILNSLKDKGAGFGYDTNKIKIITKNNKIHNFELKSKKEVAIDIVNHIIEYL
ncbi:MAG: bifunctional phosphopantothenoylcysteine decarboxylase/phosphopantothenate--cysteine ligase CoaBC [Marinilabiliales bacterium]